MSSCCERVRMCAWSLSRPHSRYTANAVRLFHLLFIVKNSFCDQWGAAPMDSMSPFSTSKQERTVDRDSESCQAIS